MNKGKIKFAGRVLRWEMSDAGVFSYTYKGASHTFEKEYIAEGCYICDDEEADEVHCTDGIAWSLNERLGRKNISTFPGIEEIFSDAKLLRKVFRYLDWGKYQESIENILMEGFESYWDICLGASNCGLVENRRKRIKK